MFFPDEEQVMWFPLCVTLLYQFITAILKYIWVIYTKHNLN